MNLKGILISSTLAWACAATLSAAPQLRLTTAALGPFVIQQGSNGPSQTVDAANIGDGSLSLQVLSSVSWLSATAGASTTCPVYKTCLPVSIALNTAQLATGVYTGIVTVGDPNAVDAPQNITVTVQIGSAVLAPPALYLAPGTSTTFGFSTASNAQVTASASWLSVALASGGTYQFAFPYTVTVTAASSMTPQQYSGSITVAGSTLAADNTTIPVTLNVTTSPIARPSPASLHLRLAANSIKETTAVAIGNGGQGTIAVTGATAATASGGSWLTATNTGNVVSVSADSATLNPGTYTGTVTVASNAANASVPIQVELDVVAQSAPIANYGGVVNNATFAAFESVAPGDIMAVYGEQFIYSGPELASTTPLPTSLGTGQGTQVLVNGQPAPLYYASYNQINFQMPYEAAAGGAIVQVVRNGQAGNQVSVEVAANGPRLLPFAIGNYGIIQNATEGGFTVSAAAGAAIGLAASQVHPAKAGTDYLTIYAIGLGPVAPAVATGAAAGTTPLSNTTLATKVAFSATTPFGQTVNAAPSFSGLAPTFVGLYQINVKVPANSPKGDSVPIYVVSGTSISNAVNVAIQ